MEKEIAFYQQCIKTLLSEYEPLQSEGSHVEVICDDERMRYLALWVGWWKSKRIHQCAIHIDICDDLIVIQCNDTEDLIATELVEMGIPREKIRLGFLPPEVQAEVQSSTTVTQRASPSTRVKQEESPFQTVQTIPA